MVNVKTQFDEAVIIIKELPPDGSVKPSEDDQLAVSHSTLLVGRHQTAKLTNGTVLRPL